MSKNRQTGEKSLKTAKNVEKAKNRYSTRKIAAKKSKKRENTDQNLEKSSNRRKIVENRQRCRISEKKVPIRKIPKKISGKRENTEKTNRKTGKMSTKIAKN